MTQRRGTAIKQGTVADVMSCLSKLPNRGKALDTAVSLSEVFRTKAYLNEIKGALKKGYTFDDLAAIFTEKCGVSVSARQLKYHCTREKNERAKNNAVEKPNTHTATNGNVPPDNSAPISSGRDAEGDIKDIEATTDVPPILQNPETFVTPNAGNAESASAEIETFYYGKRQRED